MSEACALHLKIPLDLRARKAIIRRACKILKDHPCDAIVCTGLSGTLIAPSVADKLYKQIVVVRKNTTNCHSHNYVEHYPTDIRNYIIIDDFVCDGDTVDRVLAVIKRERPAWKMTGLYLYKSKDCNSQQRWGNCTIWNEGEGLENYE